jgi:hypothetical protein
LLGGAEVLRIVDDSARRETGIGVEASINHAEHRQHQACEVGAGGFNPRHRAGKRKRRQRKQHEQRRVNRDHRVLDWTSGASPSTPPCQGSMTGCASVTRAVKKGGINQAHETLEGMGLLWRARYFSSQLDCPPTSTEISGGPSGCRGHSPTGLGKLVVRRSARRAEPWPLSDRECRSLR